MAQKFITAASLIKQMKFDLLNRTFPHFLTHLATAAKIQVQAGLAEAASKNKGKAPPLKMTVTKSPAPGSSTLSTIFVAARRPSGDQKSLTEASAYAGAFRRFYKDRLSSKGSVLKLLASVGVS